MNAPRRLIIDCDPGNGIAFSDIDDGLAIALAIADSALQLDAITIVSGNTTSDLGAASARSLLAHAGVSLPVVAGSREPDSDDHRVWRHILDSRRDEKDWAERFGGVVDIRSGEPEDGDPAGALVERVRSAPGQVTVAAIGPLTNVAEAIRRDPAFAEDVAEIAVMGGSFAHDDMPQELNFGYDPEAARVVMTSGARISLVPFDVTATTLLTEAHLDRLDLDDPLQRRIVETTRPWIRFADARFGLGGCFLHDPLVIACLIDPTLVSWKNVAVDVVVDDPIARGRPVRWQPDTVMLGGGSQSLHSHGHVRVATSVDAERLSDTLIESLRRRSA